MDNIAEIVSKNIITAIKDDQLILPTLPEVALKVREVADDPSADIESLANVISCDPALSARLIRVANSPLLRAGRPVDLRHDRSGRAGHRRPPRRRRVDVRRNARQGVCARTNDGGTRPHRG